MTSNGFQFTDTFMNFNYGLEEEEYEATPQFNESVNCSENEIQPMPMMVAEEQVQVEDEQNLNNEEVVEQNLEEFPTVRYQEAHALIRDQIKEVIFKQQFEEVTSIVLTERKKIVNDEIKHLEKLREDVIQETEELNIKLEIDKEEMENLQQRMLYNGEIADKLKEYVKSTDEAFSELRHRNQRIAEETATQKKMFSDVTSHWQSKIAQLKSDINMKKSAMGKTDKPNAYEEENLLLTSKVLEKKKRLEMLEEEYQEVILKKQRISSLEKEKVRLENILEDENRNLSELKNTKEQQESEIDERSKALTVIAEEKRSNHDALLKTHSELKNTIQTKTDEYDNLVEISKSKEQCLVQLKEKNAQISKELNDRQQELAEATKKRDQEIHTGMEKVLEIESRLSDIIGRENAELTKNLEVLEQQYVAATEEMAEKLTLKVEMEKKLRADELTLSKIQIVEEKVIRKQRAIDELSEKIENLSSDKRLQDLEKSKAYLTSSTGYMTEKYENILKELESIKVEFEDMKKDKESDDNYLLEKNKVLDNVIQILKDLNDAEEEDKNERPISSILKSPSGSRKFSVSPKKVKFEGLSSYDSSSSNDAASSQPTVGGKSLFEILNEIEAGTFKKPACNIKKRKVDLE